MRTLIGLLMVATAGFGQMRNNTSKELKCENGNWGKPRSCEVRESTMPYAGQLNVDGRQNGGVTVKGWDRADILVRARVEGSGETDGDAKAIAAQVRVNASAGRVAAEGPSTSGPGNSWWSVSYEIFAPHNANLEIVANNGGIHLADLRGNIQFKTRNGGVHVARLGGAVKGVTVNGGIHVELTGSRWDGQGLDLESNNGGVHVEIPSNYSAEFEASTRNGGLHSDFGGVSKSEKRIRTSLGSGGALVRVVTTNGGVHLGRAS